MNSKMTTNSQLLKTERNPPPPQTKPTTRIGTESQKWRSHGLSVGRRGNGGKGTGNKQHKWQVQNRWWGGGLRNVQEMQKPENLYYDPWT